ncbi:MAG: branched-chain amino acid transport protein AzlC [Bacteroidetes bacterium]|nr:MAG: branched-chain amino acid transport protein AzlC [Bacteroidota bacterium]
MDSIQQAPIKQAIKAGVPIFIGYFPPAVAFGILAKTCGISLLDTCLFSVFVFAGASQFIALSLLTTGMGPWGIILTTFLVNFRHFLMSTYLATKIHEKKTAWYLPMAFGITDEVFSVLSFTRETLTRKFILVLEAVAYSGWVSGTFAGYVLGKFIPPVISQSMSVALYALLLAIILPEIKSSLRSLVLVVSSGAMNWALTSWGIIPNGWTIIVCILVISFANACSFHSPEKEKDSHG